VTGGNVIHCDRTTQPFELTRHLLRLLRFTKQQIIRNFKFKTCQAGRRLVEQLLYIIDEAGAQELDGRNIDR
jgi:hypothetical protein